MFYVRGNIDNKQFECQFVNKQAGFRAGMVSAVKRGTTRLTECMEKLTDLLYRTLLHFLKTPIQT